jgi:excisionase family DNA binding protein
VTLTRHEAADALGVSVDHFERHVLSELRVIRSGRLVLVPVAELRRWAERAAASTRRGQPVTIPARSCAVVTWLAVSIGPHSSSVGKHLLHTRNGDAGSSRDTGAARIGAGSSDDRLVALVDYTLKRLSRSLVSPAERAQSRQLGADSFGVLGHRANYSGYRKLLDYGGQRKVPPHPRKRAGGLTPKD